MIFVKLHPVNLGKTPIRKKKAKEGRHRLLNGLMSMYRIVRLLVLPTLNKVLTIILPGRRGDLMFSALHVPGLSPGLGHCVVFLGRTSYSYTGFVRVLENLEYYYGIFKDWKALEKGHWKAVRRINIEILGV